MAEPLTIPELAAELRLSERFVRRRVVSGEWPCHRFGALYRFLEDDVAQILALTSQPTTPRLESASTAPRRVTSTEKVARVRAIKQARRAGGGHTAHARTG